MEAAGDPEEEGGGGEGGGQGGEQGGGGGGEGHPWLHGVECRGHLCGRGQGPSPLQGLVKFSSSFQQDTLFQKFDGSG